MILTTNLPFSEWNSVFSDARLCKAVVEWLTDRAHIVETAVDSFRFTNSLARSRTGRTATTTPTNLETAAPKGCRRCSRELRS